METRGYVRRIPRAGRSPPRSSTSDGLLRLGMDMDVYPSNAGAHQCLPLVMILQGAGIDKSSYSRLAVGVQAAGYWVVVPNCIPPGRDYICPDETAVRRALGSMEHVAPSCAGIVAKSGVLLV